MHLEPLDVARLFVGATVLGFASYTDWRWRRAPDALWLVTAGAGAALAAFEVARGGAEPSALPYLLLAGVFAGAIYALWWLGLLAGGADAKALMALAILVPFPLHLGAFPLLPSPLPPALGALGNALLAVLAVPLALLARNIARGALRFPHALLGVRMAVAEARRRHVWPMERADGEAVRTVLFPSRRPWTEEDWDALAARGRSEVWVTPKVPFMVPLLAGFAAAALVGDLLGAWLLGLRA